MSMPGNFDEITKGLVGPTGEPIGTTTEDVGYVNGLQWGVGFLMLRDGDGNEIVGLCHFDPTDCYVVDTEVAGELIQTVKLVCRPGNQQFIEPWEGTPGTMMELLEAHRAFDAQVAAAAAAEQSQGEPPAPPT